MKGDRAAEDELNPSRSADLCWSGRRGRGRAGGGEAGEAGAGRGGAGPLCVQEGCCGHPRPAMGPCPKAWRFSHPAHPSRPTMPPSGLVKRVTSCLDQVKGSLPRGWPGLGPHCLGQV